MMDQIEDIEKKRRRNWITSYRKLEDSNGVKQFKEIVLYLVST